MRLRWGSRIPVAIYQQLKIYGMIIRRTSLAFEIVITTQQLVQTVVDIHMEGRLDGLICWKRKRKLQLIKTSLFQILVRE